MTKYQVEKNTNVLFTGTMAECWNALVSAYGEKPLCELITDGIIINPVSK